MGSCDLGAAQSAENTAAIAPPLSVFPTADAIAFPRRGGGRHTFTYSPVVIDICCSSQSEIGRLVTNGCRMLRNTEADDFHHHEGRTKVCRLITRPMKIPILVWASFPCTWGSAWQDHTWNHGSEATRTKIRADWDSLRELSSSFESVVLPHLGHTNFEVA